MPDQTRLSHFNLKVGGSQAPKEVMDALQECSVENSLHLPDLCLLRLSDPGFHWLDAPTFREGTKLEVEATYDRGGMSCLFQGEIVALEMDLNASAMPTLLVRAYDRSHRLHRGRHSRSFVQMTDTDIVRRICREDGFDVVAEDTPQVHDWLMQNNQSNWQFLTERAARNGFRLYVRGERALHFERVRNEEADASPVTLEWGKNLRSFHPRVTAAQQVDEVIVRGWDPKAKRTLIGTSRRPEGVPQTREPAYGGEVARRVFGSACMVVVDRPIQTQREAEEMAQSLCDEMGAEYLEAEGITDGAAELRAGRPVEIANIGQRFSGRYFVTSVSHTYTTHGGYVTHFIVSGKRAPTLISLLSTGRERKNGALGSQIVIGIVTDHQDPDGLGRIKVKYPWLTEEHASFWARIVSPMAGSGRGFYFLPEIGDEVLVAFEHGDITRPYILGSLWNGQDKPVETNTKAATGGQVQRRTLKTRIGHTLLLDDTDGKGGIELQTKDGRIVSLSDADKTLTLKDAAGNVIRVNTANNSINVECQGDFIVKAQGNVRIEGRTGVTVKSAASLDLEATGPGTLKSSADLTVQGAMVRIN